MAEDNGSVGKTAAKVAIIGGAVLGGGYLLTKLLEGGISADQINISSYVVKTTQAAPGSYCTLDFIWFCVSAPTVLKLKWGFIPVREQAEYRPTFYLGLRKAGTEEWFKGPGQQGADHITEGETQDVTIATEIPTNWGDAGFVDLGIFCSGIDDPLLVIPNAVQVIWGASSQIETLSVIPVTTGDLTPDQEVEIQYTFKATGVPTPPFTTVEYTFRLDTRAGIHLVTGTDHYFGYKIELAENEEATINLLGKVSSAAVPGTPVDIEICCYSETTGSIWSTEYVGTGIWKVASFNVAATQFWYGPIWTSMTQFSPGATLNILVQPTLFAITFSNTDVVEMYGAARLEFYYNGALYYGCQKDGVTLTPGTPLAVLFPDKFTPHASGVWTMQYGFFTFGHWAILDSFNITVA